jgi:hypothetical protein
MGGNGMGVFRTSFGAFGYTITDSCIWLSLSVVSKAFIRKRAMIIWVSKLPAGIDSVSQLSPVLKSGRDFHAWELHHVRTRAANELDDVCSVKKTAGLILM